MNEQLSTLILPNGESMAERQDRLERMQAISANAMAPDLVCEWVAEHGDLTGLSTMWGVKNLQIRNWINTKFPEAYKSAVDEFIMRKVFTLSNANMDDCFEKSGIMKPVGEWPEACKLALQSVEMGSAETPDGQVLSYIKKFTLTDKMKAIELIGKRHALFVEVHELGGRGGGPIQVLTGVPQPEAIDVKAEVVEQTDAK